MKRGFAALAALVLLLSLVCSCARKPIATKDPSAEPVSAGDDDADTDTDADTDDGDDDDSDSDDGDDTDPGYRLAATKDGGDDYLSRIIFFGDLTTYHMKTNAVLGGETTGQVWYCSSDDNNALLWNAAEMTVLSGDSETAMTIGAAAAAVKPEYMVVTLGVYSAGSLSEGAFTYFYKMIIDAITENSPDTVLILQSMYPVCITFAEYGAGYGQVDSEKIRMANKWIASVAREYHNSGKSVYYLDSFDVLCGDDGEGNPMYFYENGIIPNSKGHARVIDYIRGHVPPQYNAD